MKTVLITGGNKGIGFATAERFLSEGYNVIICGRSKERLELAVSKLHSDKCSFVVWDIADILTDKSAVDEAVNCFGTIDIFINNAGIVTVEDTTGTSITEKTEKAWDDVMNINLKGTYFAIQAEVQYMLKNGIHGHIVNVCSEMGFRPATTAYGISKWGVRAMTMGLGKSLAEQGIIVNGIAPGETATEIVGNSDGIPKTIESPRGVQAKPSEMADTIYFLATQDNIIGEVIVTDGGRSLN